MVFSFMLAIGLAATFLALATAFTFVWLGVKAKMPNESSAQIVDTVESGVAREI